MLHDMVFDIVPDFMPFPNRQVAVHDDMNIHKKFKA